MDEQEKQQYHEAYKKEKEKGVPFFPDLLFKDALIALLVFLILVSMAFFFGAPLEERADPSDTSYTPRPEWYFLFLFQLLKYFPGQLEVIGVIILPTLVIALLVALPFLDRSSKRHFRHRPWVIGLTAGLVAAVIILTVLSLLEAPPPSVAEAGDQTAALYTANCAGCHGPSIVVEPGTDLHEIIAQGRHVEGMPAWSADLTANEIDALAGFILSKSGSTLFFENCSACHAAPELVAGNPLILRDSLEQGPDFAAHAGLDIPQWVDILTESERTDLLNFLAAPDGQRLFEINCASCHGQSVAFSGEESQLRTIIRQGGLHLEMPSWREKLSSTELDTLAAYVVDPDVNPQGEQLFSELCVVCHGQYVPAAENIEQAREIISSGGPHETMPVWGDILTEEQLDALVTYTLAAAASTPFELGQELYAQNCVNCHGTFGEGGPNPARRDDVIAPISSSEYLQTRNDATLQAIISEGQPNFGMSPFGTAYGGPLEDDEVDAVVAYIRSWEQNPPVELPPEVAQGQFAASAAEIYASVCAQCHGPEGEGLVGPSLRDDKFQSQNSDDDIFTTIDQGHKATSMIAWGGILTSDQIQQLVTYIRSLRVAETSQPSGPISFASDVLPIFDRACKACHGNMGGWDGSNYEAVMTTGNNAPVVFPGDSDGSLLIQKMLGTQTEGSMMPPSGALPEREIQIIIDWIKAGALDN
jgi:mono/diheme cytochrome c family protein